ncbi:hypothetical protein EL84_07340 [Paenibacillus sp. VT-400]|uniref:hypothetical protein n=1 Tax=Paenibacillus sp. VT-400 TaxID=1495853 RepID=UPI0006496DD5|nr:hypothetical protein [Paenibacillus sp. VT-400]KLU57056.1 hypothetical protein EL84_07340 [Paenibacillus sp. VT-400]
MKKKIYKWVGSEKINLKIVAPILLINVFSSLICRYFLIENYWIMANFVNTPIYVTSIILLLIGLYKNYRVVNKFSLIYLFGINAVSLINILEGNILLRDILQLWFKAISFIAIVILGLILLWKAKTKLLENFNLYLIISLITVILNFGGFYLSLYSMYYPYELQGFKIEQNMSYSQAVMPIDFLYYSADAFFGTDVSDVSLRYNDYMNLTGDTLASKYKDKYEDANFTISIAKFASIVESILFLVYISIIVLNAEGIKSKTELKESS